MAIVDFEITHYRALVGAALEAVGRTHRVRLAGALTCRSKTGGVTICGVAEGVQVPANTVGPDQSGVIFVPARQFPWYVDLLRNEKPIGCHLDLSWPTGHHVQSLRTVVGATETTGRSHEPPPSLATWLQHHARVRDTIIWDGTAYSDWSDERRAALRAAFRASWRRHPSDAPSDPPPNVAVLSERQVLSETDAWKLYLGYAAHALANEIASRLPWSIRHWPPSRLRDLLDSRQMFTHTFDGFEISMEQHGQVVPCSVDRAWQFVLTSALVRGSAFDTVGRVLDWCRVTLTHFAGDESFDNMEEVWGYRGFPPVSRMIDGTDGPQGFLHYTAGCWGTAGFLRTVLRVVNIPVRIVVKIGNFGSHALPFFPSIGRYLTHGDDPYSQITREALPNYSCSALLITRSRFDELFNDQLSLAQRRLGVGRRPVELALEHLPARLLAAYCDDQANNLDHASGTVFGQLSQLGRTVEELEDAGLWRRMDQKIAALGGCGRIPTDF